MARTGLPAAMWGMLGTMIARHDPPARGYWACQGLGWGAYCVAIGYQLMRDDSWAAQHGTTMPMGRVISEPLAIGCLGIVLTHLIRSWARWRGWANLTIAGLAPRIALASAALGLWMMGGLGVLE